MLSQIIFLLSLLTPNSANAVVECTNDVKFSKELGVRAPGGTIKLLLNGVGRKRVLGFNVFYAGLYLEKPNSNATSILKSSQLKLGIIHTTMNISRRRITQMWDEQFNRLCGDECESLKPYHDLFLSYARDVSRNERLYMILYPDRFEFIINNEEVYEPIYSPEYALLMQRVLIGPEADDKDLESALLGKTQVCRGYFEPIDLNWAGLQ